MITPLSGEPAVNPTAAGALLYTLWQCYKKMPQMASFYKGEKGVLCIFGENAVYSGLPDGEAASFISLFAPKSLKADCALGLPSETRASQITLGPGWGRPGGGLPAHEPPAQEKGAKPGVCPLGPASERDGPPDSKKSVFRPLGPACERGGPPDGEKSGFRPLGPASERGGPPDSEKSVLRPLGPASERDGPPDGAEPGFRPLGPACGRDGPPDSAKPGTRRAPQIPPCGGSPAPFCPAADMRMPFFDGKGVCDADKALCESEPSLTKPPERQPPAGSGAVVNTEKPPAKKRKTSLKRPWAMEACQRVGRRKPTRQGIPADRQDIAAA